MKILATLLTVSVLVAMVATNSLAALPRSKRAYFGWFGSQPANLQSYTEEYPEKYLETDGIIKRWGYEVEKYDVTTEDGYILTIFRIPRAKNQTETPTGPRPVILIQHGLLGSSVMWVNNKPDQDAAFIYADAGYDVWLGNFRGNKNGKKHTKLSPEKDKMAFWDFSWPEMAKYDLPAMINFILNTTGAPNLYYMGHSMGTLTAFVAFSQDRELGKKVKKFYALAPVMKLQNIRGAMAVVAKTISALNYTLYTFGMEEYLPASPRIGQFTRACAITERIGINLCGVSLFLIAGPSSNQLNTARLPVYLSHTPAGTSRRTFIHFGQMVNSGKISQYDFGVAKNLERYNSLTPPEYDVTQMETPVGLFWGDNDWLANDVDIRSMAPRLKNVFAKTYLGDFNHIDFLWGKRVTDEVYLPIMRDIRADFDHKAGDCPVQQFPYLA